MIYTRRWLLACICSLVIGGGLLGRADHQKHMKAKRAASTRRSHAKRRSAAEHLRSKLTAARRCGLAPAPESTPEQPTPNDNGARRPHGFQTASSRVA